MSIPAGAYAVQYTISAYDEGDADPEISVQVQFPINEGHPQASVEDAAAQAAADAYVSAVEAAYPTVPVHASRTYLCRVPDSSWPAP